MLAKRLRIGAGTMVAVGAAVIAASVFGVSAWRAEANLAEASPAPMPVSAYRVTYEDDALIEQVREHLEQAVEKLDGVNDDGPYAGYTRFALARAIWGPDPAQRARAHELAQRSREGLRVDGRFTRWLAELDSWLRKHPPPDVP